MHERGDQWRVEKAVIDKQGFAGALRCCLHGLRLSEIGGHRFFAEHVLTRIHGSDGQRRVRDGLGTDIDAFNIVASEHGFDVRVHLGIRTVLFAFRVSQILIEVADGDDFSVRQRLIAPEMDRRNSPATNDTDVDFLIHEIMCEQRVLRDAHQDESNSFWLCPVLMSSPEVVRESSFRFA